MRAPSRMILLTAMASGAVLSGTATGLADDEGALDAVDKTACDTARGVADALVGCASEGGGQPSGNPETRPAGNNGGGTSDTGVSTGGTDAGDDGGAATTSDEGSDDDGSTPVGGIETGAGGTAAGGSAAPAALAGGALVAAGGVLLTRRTHGRHVRRGRHAL